MKTAKPILIDRDHPVESCRDGPPTLALRGAYQRPTIDFHCEDSGNDVYVDDISVHQNNLSMKTSKHTAH
jgi:hypothetical protein